MALNTNYTGLEIAIIGISGRFPQSDNYRQYWENLTAGRELIKTFSDEELSASGVSQADISNSEYVRSGAVINQKDVFDSLFFGYSSDEASIMDPQIRLFHEHCWMALDDAGYSSLIEQKKIGLFAGASMNDNWKIYAYAMYNTLSVDPFYSGLLSAHNYISTLVAYKLNLRGPAVFIDTACSTSLTAVHIACRSLLTKECSMALAGGVLVNTIKAKGYVYQEGMISSKDGHCRAFDAQANGTVLGEGAGVVVLKKLSEAIKDRDHIYAVIRATSANNDGSNKVGFTAPGIKGQAECIINAHKLAGVKPDSISYIEAHGTGTPLGDPVEISALNAAFNTGGENKFCAIGSVKTNMGHLDSAAGVAGLIKTALCLKYKQIPPSLHYTQPNPEIDFANGPFYVNTKLKNWTPDGETPLRAGVNSFGIGGTNVHVVLEEAPPAEQVAAVRKYNLLTVSAKTETALNRYLNNFCDFLQQEPGINSTDMAYTLQVGRKHFRYRKSIVYNNSHELINLIRSEKLQEQAVKMEERSGAIIFMFPGQGSQYVNMGRDLYEQEPLFREVMDKGFFIISGLTGIDYKEIVYSVNDDGRLQDTRYTQPLVFLLEYALANLIMSYGILPQYMIGHSLGEYVAACISGVFAFEDALQLVVKRAALMSSLPNGIMLSIAMNEEDVKAYLDDGISLAAVNAPGQVVLSGDPVSVQQLIARLEKLQIPFVKLHTSHAFHSAMQDTILPAFREELEKVKFNEVKYPFISNLTGELINTLQACSPDYWIDHLRYTVRFADGVHTLLSKTSNPVFIEVGAGNALGSMVKQQLSNPQKATSVNLLRTFKEQQNDCWYLTDKIGKLWNCGVDINWDAYYNQEKRNRVSLPAYSFDPIVYPTEVNAVEMIAKNMGADYGGKKKNINDWFYNIQWRQSLWLPGKEVDYTGKTVLVFCDGHGLAEKLIAHLTQWNARYILVREAQAYEKKQEDLFTVNPYQENDIAQLFQDLKSTGIAPSFVLHLWSFGLTHQENADDSAVNALHHKNGYESLLYIARAIASFFANTTIQLDVVSNGWYKILGDEMHAVHKTTALGAIKVIPLELPEVSCRAIDIVNISTDTVNALARELKYVAADTEVGIRGKNKYVKHFEKIHFEIPNANTIFRNKGTYVLTGANGGMGRLFADFLAEQFQANLVLTARKEAPTEFIDGLEKKGARVLFIKADVTDASSLADGFCQAEETFGQIHGVIHTAGLPDTAGVIIKRAYADDQRIFAPKIKGTEVLDSLFRDRTLDFFVNCSSLAATLPLFGEIAYVTANIFQDAMAEHGNRQYPVISIGWPALQEIGMSVNASAHLSAAEQASALKEGIKPAEAIGVLLCSIFLKIPVQVISTTNLKQYYRNYFSAMKAVINDGEKKPPAGKKDRAGISATYIAPQTGIELRLTGMMEDFLQVEGIGIEDDFFELGGDSLKAMVFIKRINKEFNVSISVKEFLGLHTIKQMAAEIDNINWLKSDVTMARKLTI